MHGVIAHGAEKAQKLRLTGKRQFLHDAALAIVNALMVDPKVAGDLVVIAAAAANRHHLPLGKRHAGHLRLRLHLAFHPRAKVRLAQRMPVGLGETGQRLPFGDQAHLPQAMHRRQHRWVGNIRHHRDPQRRTIGAHAHQRQQRIDGRIIMGIQLGDHVIDPPCGDRVCQMGIARFM
ncbi:hypothetical protein N4G58_02065 [Edwardsiella piscicida]|nr:hypothetical protein N4G58_02065 [Edwardsiella piscicida]